MKRVLKTATLALLAIVCIENTSADNDLVSKDCNAHATSSSQTEQQHPWEPSQVDQTMYDRYIKILFGEGDMEEKIYLRKTDDATICIVKGVKVEGIRPVDIVGVTYVNNKMKEEYFKLKNAGKNPDITEYPYEQIYMIPLSIFAVEDVFIPCVASPTDMYGHIDGIDRGYVLSTRDRLFFKKEVYPEYFVEMNHAGHVSLKDAEQYFNFKKEGWVGLYPIDACNRCGLTGEFSIYQKDAKLIVDYIKNNYPKIAHCFKYFDR